MTKIRLAIGSLLTLLFVALVAGPAYAQSTLRVVPLNELKILEGQSARNGILRHPIREPRIDRAPQMAQPHRPLFPPRHAPTRQLRGPSQYLGSILSDCAFRKLTKGLCIATFRRIILWAIPINLASGQAQVLPFFGMIYRKKKRAICGFILSSSWIQQLIITSGFRRRKLLKDCA